MCAGTASRSARVGNRVAWWLGTALGAVSLLAPAAEPVPQAAEPVPRAAEPVPQAAEPVPRAAEPVPRAAEPGPRAAEPGLRAAEPGLRAADEGPQGREAQIAELSAQLTELRQEWESHQEELAEAAAAAERKSSWKLTGRVHLDNWSFPDEDAGISFLETGDPTDDPEDRWDFRRIRLEFAGEVPDNMLFRIQIDFNNPAAAAMKDVYLGFNGLPHNQTFLIGNQKRPLGLDHLNSSRFNVFIERPLAVETFNEDARRLGAAMYGYTDDELYHWRYGLFFLENITTDGRYRGDFDQGGLYGRISSSPWYDETSGGRGYYHWAIAGSANVTHGRGDPSRHEHSNEARFRTRPLARSTSRWWNTGRISGAENYEQLAVESMLNLGSLQFTGEYFGNWVQRDPFAGFAGDDMFFHGGYVFASYFLTGEHVPYDRTKGVIGRVKPLENFFVVERVREGIGRGWGAFAVGLRFDYLDLTDSDIQGGQGWAATAGLNWHWTAHSKLQTNLIRGEINDAGEAQNPSPSLAGVDGDFTIVGMRYMLDF